MSSIRPLYRPSIRELANYLLCPKPQVHSRRCITNIAPSARPSVPNSPYRLPVKSARFFVSTTPANWASPKPATRDRGPASKEDTQTDFGALNVLGSTPAPSTSIDACLWDGFHLDSGVKITGGTGVLLVAGEAFSWKPWTAGNSGLRLVNAKGQWEVDDEAWGILSLVWPKPDLLILGLGREMRPISPKTRRYINSLGMRVDIQDTRNAAAQFNLLATERGVGTIAAALIPIGFTEGVGVK